MRYSFLIEVPPPPPTQRSGTPPSICSSPITGAGPALCPPITLPFHPLEADLWPLNPLPVTQPTLYQRGHCVDLNKAPLSLHYGLHGTNSGPYVSTMGEIGLIV